MSKKVSLDFIHKTIAKRLKQDYINKYNKENYAIFSFRRRKDYQYFRFKEILKENKISISSFFNGVIDEFIEMDFNSRN